MAKQNRDRKISEDRPFTEKRQPQSERKDQGQVTGGTTSSDEPRKTPSSQRQPGRLPLPD